MPTTEYVVVDFPTIMDGYVVRWYAAEHDANHGDPIISASRNGVVKHTPGVAADALEALAMEVHDLIASWYGRHPAGCGAGSEKPWQHVLTHRASMFRDVEPIAREEAHRG
jgi:hypothetical protein